MSVKKFFVFYCLLIALPVIFLYCAENLLHKPYITIDGIPVYVELAVTDEEKELGLMYRRELPEDHGMLFICEEPGYYYLWMKNTYISLDIIWFDENCSAVYIVKYAEPNSTKPMGPSVESMYIVEVKAGFVDKYGMHLGSKLELP